MVKLYNERGKEIWPASIGRIADDVEPILRLHEKQGIFSFITENWEHAQQGTNFVTSKTHTAMWAAWENTSGSRWGKPFIVILPIDWKLYINGAHSK